jgi:predicted RNase H-like HicB family nuclease
MKIEFKVVYVRDKVSGEYTAWFEEFPHVITEGKTKEEANENLSKMLYDILQHYLTSDYL